MHDYFDDELGEYRDRRRPQVELGFTLANQLTFPEGVLAREFTTTT